MFRKSLSVILCLMILATMCPIGAMAGEVTQNLPINDGMENAGKITGVNFGTVALTQDKVSGKYAVKVAVGDEPGKNFAEYALATSEAFDINKYSQIRLWVKPGAGAKWIEFWTGTDGMIKSDKNENGRFEVGQDLIGGKWNEVTLDLTRLSNTSLTQGKDLRVRTNELSTWSYDEISLIYAPVANVDLLQMVNCYS